MGRHHSRRPPRLYLAIMATGRLGSDVSMTTPPAEISSTVGNGWWPVLTCACACAIDAVNGVRFGALELSPETQQRTRGGLLVRLTAREHEVRDLVSQGMPDKDIATALHISVKTVEKHVGSVLRKHGVHSRTELIAHG